jgi:hypothetical protein
VANLELRPAVLALPHHNSSISALLQYKPIGQRGGTSLRLRRSTPLRRAGNSRSRSERRVSSTCNRTHRGYALRVRLL